MKTKTLLFAVVLLMAACSLRSKDKGSENQAMLQDSNEFEFAVDNVNDVLTENTEEDVAKVEQFSEPETLSKIEDNSSIVKNDKDEFLDEMGPAPTEPVFEEFKVAEKTKEVQEMPIETPIAPMAFNDDPKPETKVEKEISPVEYSADFHEYQVQTGDTLMMIGFKLFGDYRTWKQLKEWNNLSSMELKRGMIIKYRPSMNDSFSWRPNGEPHLVKKGEYLGSISFDKYGTSRRWKEIFDNNKPLLRDPNLIFAGFTIYYVPDKRSVASEK